MVLLSIAQILPRHRFVVRGTYTASSFKNLNILDGIKREI